MEDEFKRTHKYMWPVTGPQGIRLLEVHRRDSKTKKTIYLGRHKTVTACCKALQARFPKEKAQFTPSNLLLEQGQQEGQRRLEKVKYKGITPRRGAGGKMVWQVQRQYDTPQWQYGTQIAAARAIAKALGIGVEGLKHKKPSLTVTSRSKFRKLHGAAMGLYKNRKPADVEDLEEHAKKSKTIQILRRFPGLIPSFLMAKISRIRNDIIKCGEEQMQKRQTTKGKASQEISSEEQHYHALARAAKRASCYRWSTEEERNVGRNNFHWMNFPTMLIRLEILSLTQRRNIHKRALTFHKTGTQYYLCDWMSDLKSWILRVTFVEIELTTSEGSAT